MSRLELFYPVRPFSLIQAFGECFPSVCAKYHELGLEGHNGMDLRAAHGQIVRAAHDGIVTFAGEDGAAGYGIVIRTDKPFAYNDDEAYYKTIYWHLQKDGILVRAGQAVSIGDVIGLADNTGFSTGDHLHFGLKPVYKGEQDWEWWNAAQTNGFKGAIDPMPFMRPIYADSIASIRAQIKALTIAIAALFKSRSA